MRKPSYCWTVQIEIRSSRDIDLRLENIEQVLYSEAASRAKLDSSFA